MENPGSTQLTWRKSSRSGSQGSACVEVAALGGGFVVRDSQDPQGPLASPHRRWRVQAASGSRGVRAVAAVLRPVPEGRLRRWAGEWWPATPMAC
jgi:hypothetical protein